MTDNNTFITESTVQNPPPVQKTYSIPRQIWRAVNMPLIYLGMQVVLTFVITVGYGVWVGISEGLGGEGAEIDGEALAENIANFGVSNAMLITLISGLLSGLIFMLIWNKERRFLPPKTRAFSLQNAVVVMLLGFALNILVNSFLEFSGLYERFTSYDTVVDMIVSGSFVLRLITIGIVAPIVEELCFRGLLFNRLNNGKMPVVGAMIISSLIFGIVHLNLLQSSYAFVLGMFMVIVYYLYQTIWAAIIIHVAINSFTVCLAGLEEINSAVMLVMIAMSVVFVAVFAAVTVKQLKGVKNNGSFNS
ncbi:MAG: CPBP family intramembrane metalloprotease [Oscillospiraceae bacterium]|nr:CPBP family intramembrane metalloprotease [Oscillospiraceae bacterium]